VNEETNNVINFPMTRGMRLRHSFNKAKEKLFEPEQVEYEKPFEPINDHKEATDYFLHADLSRPEHFEQGQQDATVHSFRDQQIKRNMRAGDESVERMINMDDPTKD
jgi:hypothetical protein